MYFQEVFHEWDADELSAQRYNYIIERLSQYAAQLDELVPQLEEELARRGYPNSTRPMVTNAVEMQSCLNSFLNSADEGLNYWKHQEGRDRLLLKSIDSCESKILEPPRYFRRKRYAAEASYTTL
jgi:hypothetical protein